MKILIAGDFCPIHRADINRRSGEVLDDNFKILLNNVDLRIINLECPLTKHITPISKTGPALKADPKNILFLKENRFNLVTLANNHIMDYGYEGIKETIQHLKINKIDYVGAGKTSEEIKVIFKTKDNFTIGIINVCENEWSTDKLQGYKANGFSEIDMFYTIKEANKKADKVIVIHHGGHEMYPLPSPRLKKTFRFFIDCGANAVINHHTHCIGGEEIYKGSPILYSLGNFIFDNPKERNSIWNYGMAVVLNCNKEGITFEKHYFEQFNKDAKVHLVNKENLFYNIEELNTIISDDTKLLKEFESFVQKKQKLYLSYLEPTKSKLLLFLINRGFLPSLWHRRKKQYLKNLINCESHEEIVKKILYDETSYP